MSATDRRPPSDRDADDAAAVTVVLALLADRPVAASATSSGAPSVWADPAHRLGLRPAPSPAGWWSSGLPR